jgi:tRNA(fMet)-specific endonuclease VapC
VTDVRFLLDTNICIYHLMGASRALSLRIGTQIDDVATSSICYAEIMLGHARSAAGEPSAAADAFFRKVRVLPFDRDAADAYAGLPFRRARFDRLVAAHALALGAVLVSNNVRDFADIPGLKIENWVP